VTPRPLTPLDRAFDTKRRELFERTENAVARAWTVRNYGDRESFVRQAVALVEGGQRQTVDLVNGYMVAKLRQLVDGGAPRTVPPSDFTVEKLRGVPAAEVYDRPFGALGYHLSLGAEFKVADQAGEKDVRRLVSVDLLLALTHSMKAWMEAHKADL
jgi:hypothetical protein